MPPNPPLQARNAVPAHLPIQRLRSHHPGQIDLPTPPNTSFALLGWARKDPDQHVRPYVALGAKHVMCPCQYIGRFGALCMPIEMRMAHIPESGLPFIKTFVGKLICSRSLHAMHPGQARPGSPPALQNFREFVNQCWLILKARARHFPSPNR